MCAKVLVDHWQPLMTERPIRIGLANAAIGPFVAQWPASLEHTLSYHAFCDILHSLFDSGVGVDGFPYSCWSHAPDVIKHCLFDCYTYIFHHRLDAGTAAQFLDGRMICIQKTSETMDSTSCFVRKPPKTRPLVLSNTDMKIV